MLRRQLLADSAEPDEARDALPVQGDMHAPDEHDAAIVKGP